MHLLKWDILTFRIKDKETRTYEMGLLTETETHHSARNPCD